MNQPFSMEFSLPAFASDDRRQPIRNCNCYGSHINKTTVGRAQADGRAQALTKGRAVSPERVLRPTRQTARVRRDDTSNVARTYGARELPLNGTDSVPVIGSRRALDVMLSIEGTWTARTNYCDCPMHWLKVMLELAKRGGEAPMQDIRETSGTTASSMTRTAVRLGAGDRSSRGMGWLRSFEDPTFRRRKILQLTPSGWAVVDRMTAATQAAVTEAVNRSRH